AKTLKGQPDVPTLVEKGKATKYVTAASKNTQKSPCAQAWGLLACRRYGKQTRNSAVIWLLRNKLFV
ncbi:MAG: hypothetical protein RSC25_07880, partial [Christensenella sp.]